MTYILDTYTMDLLASVKCNVVLPELLCDLHNVVIPPHACVRTTYVISIPGQCDLCELQAGHCSFYYWKVYVTYMLGMK